MIFFSTSASSWLFSSLKAASWCVATFSEKFLTTVCTKDWLEVYRFMGRKVQEAQPLMTCNQRWGFFFTLVSLGKMFCWTNMIKFKLWEKRGWARMWWSGNWNHVKSRLLNKVKSPEKVEFTVSVKMQNLLFCFSFSVVVWVIIPIGKQHLGAKVIRINYHTHAVFQL